MTDTDPKKDFRYTLGDIELEGYQITPQTRWLNQRWPSWLRMQRLPDEMNCVFSMSEDTNRLWLALPTGDVELPDLAWIVKYPDGHMGFVDALAFDEAIKVVPIPAPVVHPPADGIVDGASVAVLKPVPSVENVVGDITEMRNEMMSTIKLLQEGTEQGEGLPPKAEEALDYLIHAMSKRTKWCNCAPGMCDGEDMAGCRLNSPLVKT